MKSTLLTLGALLTAGYIIATNSHIDSPSAAPTFGLRFDDKCPEPLAVECMATIQMSIRDCTQSAKHPTDISAEVGCVKDLMSDKKLCWPCICEESNKFIKVKGCPSNE